MFGCIGKIVVLAVLIVLGAVAYVTRGMWEPKVREKLGMKPAATTAALAPGWQPVTVEGAARARAAVESFQRPAGPAFVNVGTGDIVAYALEPFLSFLGAAKSAADTTAESTAALAEENTITVRGSIQLSRLSGLDVGGLGLSMTGTQRVSFRGTPRVVSPGKATFHVDRIYIGQLMLSGPIVGRIMRQVAPRADAGQPAGTIALALPAHVADIRVTGGRVTLYKAAR